MIGGASSLARAIAAPLDAGTSTNNGVRYAYDDSRMFFYRGTSHLTGFLIRKTHNGSFLGYISQTDPRGKLPSWLVNKITQKFAPRVVKQLLKASEGYEFWKSRQMGSNFKPWVYPEQTLLSPRISISDVSVLSRFCQCFDVRANFSRFCFVL